MFMDRTWYWSLKIKGAISFAYTTTLQKVLIGSLLHSIVVFSLCVCVWGGGGCWVGEDGGGEGERGITNFHLALTQFNLPENFEWLREFFNFFG